jgi:hypothetical protein
MRRTLLGLIVATAVGGGSASAHRSYGAYFENETVSIEGTIATIRFANPRRANSGAGEDVTPQAPSTACAAWAPAHRQT